MDTILARAAWLGGDLADLAQWRVQLDEPQRQAIVADAARLRVNGIGLDAAAPGDAAVACLSPVAHQVRGLLFDRGVALVDGFPVAEVGALTSAAFWCFASLVGVPIGQNRDDQRVDVVQNEARATVRGAKTDRELIFHTDLANVVPDWFGLLVERPARSGGESLVASGVTLYRELARTRPAELAELGSEFYFDRTGDVPAGIRQWLRSAIFRWHDGDLRVRYNRGRIHRGHRVAGVPLRAEQVRALDVLDDLLRDDRFVFRVSLRAGQALFVNNAWHLHSRTRFADWPEAARRRRLLRVWLRQGIS